MALLNLGDSLSPLVLANSATEIVFAGLALMTTMSFAFVDKQMMSDANHASQDDAMLNELSAKYDPADSQAPILARFSDLKDYVAR